MTKKSEEKDFAGQLTELEGITKWFEQGDVSIEEALAKFERGLGLAQELQTYLSSVEQRVVDMKKKFNV
jgi:exodeoxyribonuclease VII small subunit